MNTKTDTRSVLKKHLIRGVAAFFVLFIGFHFVFPQLCMGDSSDPPRASRALASVADDTGTRSAASVSEDSQQDQQSRQTRYEKHCISCCAHVLPGQTATAVIFVSPTSLIFDVKHDSVPSSLLEPPFRPPRQA